jgi:predicted RNase H-like HicB family nuclease
MHWTDIVLVIPACLTTPRPRRYAHGVSKSVTFTAIYETVENGWVQARLAEIPGVITAAPTRDEAEAMLIDALREFVLSFTEPHDAGSQPAGSQTTAGHVGITFSAA